MKAYIYKSAAIVTIFSVVEKTVSFLYRIFLSRSIGAEGVGIYQICLSVFAVFLTIASSGIPVTVSRLIAKQNADGNAREKNAVVTAGVVSTLLITIPTVIILFLLRNHLGFLFSDNRCIDIFLIILPGLIITAIYAVMRGAFWGNKQFLPYSLIELTEDSLMVILGIIFISFSTSTYDGAVGAARAVIISYVFSFAVSTAHFLRHGGAFVNPKSQLKPLLASSLPITAMRASTSLINSAVAVILPLLLTSVCGYSDGEAVALYGVALGMAIPVLFTPTTLIGSISVVVAPELSENYYRGNMESVKSDAQKCVKAAILIAVLLIPIFYTLGESLGVLLYSNALSGEIISRCSFIMLPLAISLISTTLLNSLGCEKSTLLTFFIGAASMLICIFALTPVIGIYGYMVGVALDFSLNAVLNLRVLSKKCGGLNCLKYLLGSTAVTLGASLFGTFLKGLTANLPTLVNLFICGGVVFAFTTLALLGMGVIDLAPLKRIVFVFSRKKLHNSKRYQKSAEQLSK